MTIEEVEARVDALHAQAPDEPLPSDALDVVETLIGLLERGEIRSARRADDGTWHAVAWVKRGILLAFRFGRIVPMGGSGPSAADGGSGDHAAPFHDKDTLPARMFTPSDGVRIVPGGSAIRRGAYIAPGVVCMPPMYVNVGAYVDAGTMIDSHALVGSCAQVGRDVHVSAAAQLGGVLEPINASPVVVEDEVVVGGNTGVYEGTIVRRRAVLGAGVVLTRGTPVFDLVRETVHRGSGDRPLEIPEDAVVVGGSRTIRSDWARSLGLSLYSPVIVKYRDEKTDLATALEEWLR